MALILGITLACPVYGQVDLTPFIPTQSNNSPTRWDITGQDPIYNQDQVLDPNRLSNFVGDPTVSDGLLRLGGQRVLNLPDAVLRQQVIPQISTLNGQVTGQAAFIKSLGPSLGSGFSGSQVGSITGIPAALQVQLVTDRGAIIPLNRSGGRLAFGVLPPTGIPALRGLKLALLPNALFDEHLLVGPGGLTVRTDGGDVSVQPGQLAQIGLPPATQISGLTANVVPVPKAAKVQLLLGQQRFVQRSVTVPYIVVFQGIDPTGLQLSVGKSPGTSLWSLLTPQQQATALVTGNVTQSFQLCIAAPAGAAVLRVTAPALVGGAQTTSAAAIYATTPVGEC
ncbi:hypothetical protein [Anthocerotibacter panamensis]|uniref:hypothetical protein n=1 Tax=Anthocerotibacter panamensis TaxID=2857077 RepID=UPI001C4032FF|nr:hypothetical protein [Anthocerotibacter panamensis]